MASMKGKKKDKHILLSRNTTVWFQLIGIMLHPFFSHHNLNAQNRVYTQSMIDTLASPAFYGRGYVNNGDTKAANFLAKEFAKTGLKPLVEGKNIKDSVMSRYFHPFQFEVNSFPKKCKVWVNGKRLLPGIDYLVSPDCPSIKAKFKIANGDMHTVKNKRRKALVLDTSYKIAKDDRAIAEQFGLKVNLEKKLTWSASTFQNTQPEIDLLKTSMPPSIDKIKVKIKSKLETHDANNVLGYIEGTEIKDTFIVLSAHYDHLGMMGDALFPGANDNASGVAMMLDLSHYFIKNPCKYSIAFIAFAGEEPGLIGSKAYTDHPFKALPLSKIKFLVNLDLMGSGEKGMAVVNATIFPEYFNKLKDINEKNNYLTGFKARGKAANSDHYWFVERGVKGFFFYLMGEYHFYHEVNDAPKNLRLGPYYDKSFLLIRDFIKGI